MENDDIHSFQNEPYTSKEIYYFLEEVRSDLKEIKAQVVKTNGTVASVRQWIERANGALIVVGFLGLTGFISWLVLIMKNV